MLFHLVQNGPNRWCPVRGQLLAGLGQVVGKCRVIPLDDLVAQCLFGSVALVPNTAAYLISRMAQ